MGSNKVLRDGDGGHKQRHTDVRERSDGISLRDVGSEGFRLGYSFHSLPDAMIEADISNGKLMSTKDDRIVNC